MKKLILVSFLILASCSNEKPHFKVEPLENNLVRISHSDGNHWITTKDSIQIYINNY